MVVDCRAGNSRGPSDNALRARQMPPSTLQLTEHGKKEGQPSANLLGPLAERIGPQVSDAKRLRSLEEENRKLKKLLAEAHLDLAALKDIASGKF